MIVGIAATAATSLAAEATVRSLSKVAPGLQVQVLDVDGVYHRQATEIVVTQLPNGLPINRLRLLCSQQELGAALTGAWAASILGGLSIAEPVLAVAPGVLFLTDPSPLFSNLKSSVLVRRTSSPLTISLNNSLTTPDFYMLGAHVLSSLPSFLQLLYDPDTASKAHEVFITAFPHQITANDAILVSRDNTNQNTKFEYNTEGHLVRGNKEVLAIDLSGFSPNSPWLFDARSPENSGPLLSRNPELAQIMGANVKEWVSDSALDKAGSAISSSHEFNRDEAVRSGILRFDDDSQLPNSSTDLEPWLLTTEVAVGVDGISRYLKWVWESRPDLQQVFPAIPGGDNDKFAEWARSSGAAESRYNSELMMKAAARLASTASLEPRGKSSGLRQRGVNLIGFLSGGFGLGTAARLTAEGVKATGVPVSTFTIANLAGGQASIDYQIQTGSKYDLTLMVLNEHETKLATEVLGDVVEGTYRIGVWAWEVEQFSVSDNNGFELLDEVWVATKFIKKILDPISPIPVRKVMPPLPQKPIGDAPGIPEGFDLNSDDQYFLFVFSYHSVAERKNPWGLVEAYCQAFTPDDGVKLVIKTMGSRQHIKDAERLRLLAATRNDIIIVDRTLSESELMGLMSHCAAYVSLHRSEGTGLTIAEAMAWGRPVIVSGYSGNLEFTNSLNSILIPCRKVPVPKGLPPYPAGALWGDPDLHAAAEAMRFVILNPAAAAAIGNQAARDIAEMHSPAAVAPAFLYALNAAWERADVMQKQAEAAARKNRSALRRVKDVLYRLLLRPGNL